MKGLIVVVSLFIYYSSASVLVKEDAEDELLSREKREVSYWAENKPDTLDGCDAGEFAVEVRNENGKLTGFRCEPCAEGYFTQAAGFWKKCVPCELEHQTTPPGYNGKCYDKCIPGKGWNSTLKKCLPCDAEFYQPEDSFNECRKCPLFHNSTKADANCLLECPRGMEPTEDGSSCTQCKVGYFQKVPGRKGVNEKCVICCEPPCDPNKNWTYVVGANATNQCIKLPNPLKTCFPYLITALEKAAKYIYEDDTKETLRPLLTALCLSGANLQEMANQIQACSVKEVTVAGVKVPAYPQLRINGTFVLDMKSEVFDIHGTPQCPQTTTTEPTTTEPTTSEPNDMTKKQSTTTTVSTSSTLPSTSSSSTSSTSSTTSRSSSTTSSTTTSTTETPPPGKNPCIPGKGWNSTLKKCLPCEAGFYQPEESFNECRKCPLFHNSTKADAECLLECPRGMEPTDDGSSCTQCKVGYFQKVPGRKGVNEKCVICCEPPCLTLKNWTYVVGANATNQCIKLPNPLKTCYPYLITALEKAAKYIYADDTKETLRPLLTALCLSGADLPEMVTQIQACGVKEVTVAGVKVPAYPKLRINATLVLDMKTEVFNIHGTPECPQTTTTEPTTTESSNAGEDQASPTTDSTSSTSPITSSSSTSSTSSTTSPTDSTSSTAEPSNADEDQGSSTTGSISSTSPTSGSSSTSSTSSTNSFTDSTSSTTTAEPGNADENQGSQTTDSTSTTPPTTSPSSTSSTSSTTSSTSSTASTSSTSSTTSSSSTSSTSSTTSTTGTSEATTASTTTTTEFFLS